MELGNVPYAAYNEHWDCLQYAVDNKCDEWENTPRSTRSTSDEMPTIDEYDLRTFSHSFITQTRNRT